MAKTRSNKEQTVKNISDKLQKAKSVVFTDYQGLTMKNLSDLRDKLRDQQAEFTITKNTLLKLALGQKQNIDEQVLEGPTATLFAYDDEVSPIKILVKTLKDATLGKIKGGILADAYIDSTKVNQLASLPNKDELKGKTVGVLAAPLQGMVGVLQGNLRNLVYALEQIRIKKEVKNRY